MSNQIISSIVSPMELVPGFVKRSQISPVQAVKTLFSYPYVNFIPQFFQRTRDYSLGLSFIASVKGIISQNTDAFSFEESDEIDLNLTILELSCLDHLNLWEQYIESFEYFILSKQTPAFLVRLPQTETKKSQYGRYLVKMDLLCSGNSNLPQSNSAYVHRLFYLDERFNIIKRKAARRSAGKNVEHLKRHTIEMLSDKELNSRYESLLRLWKIICSRAMDYNEA